MGMEHGTETVLGPSVRLVVLFLFYTASLHMRLLNMIPLADVGLMRVYSAYICWNENTYNTGHNTLRLARYI